MSRYDTVPKGTSQLKLMAAAVFNENKSDRSRLVDTYGVPFWRNIESKYPDLMTGLKPYSIIDDLEKKGDDIENRAIQCDNQQVGGKFYGK